MVITNGMMTVNLLINKTLNYDVIRDFTHISPSGMPAHILGRLEDAMAKMLKSESMQSLISHGSRPTLAGSEAFQGRMRKEVANWKDVFSAS
ncbi:hypothetical protein [Cupriavidus basilensis]|uniref:hypothetical protein n=1 Tax=Cupriavidus basilensis TaxID=68895 RepID=UPI0020A6C962|nr:hypothetical protein [Cupriavidus basilensis]MCP3023982.1 hypothetical protein [Cupriavidus basilensis]